MVKAWEGWGQGEVGQCGGKERTSVILLIIKKKKNCLDKMAGWPVQKSAIASAGATHCEVGLLSYRM